VSLVRGDGGRTVVIAHHGREGIRPLHHIQYSIASAYALLRQPRAAVRWLRRTAENGLPCYPLFASDRNLNNIRGDPAFVPFLR